MMQLQWQAAQRPARVVILGARGFIGRALAAKLAMSGQPHLVIGSADIDLTAETSAQALAAKLQPDDALVMLSAVTPDKGRDVDISLRNLVMGRNVCAALSGKPCAHVIYISSDAVYPFISGLVSERTPAAPIDLYGSMHRMRELMFEAAVKSPLAILRPTMVYGADDTHNSYGPNRFRRQAAKDGKIMLGGGGEETRDNIYIDDAVRLIELTLQHRASGKLNLASGRSLSAHALATLIVGRFPTPVEIVTTPRAMPVTHRSFDITACRKAFPTFAFTPLETGLAVAHRSASSP